MHTIDTHEKKQVKMSSLILLSREYMLNNVLLIWLTRDHENDTFVIQK